LVAAYLNFEDALLASTGNADHGNTGETRGEEPKRPDSAGQHRLDAAPARKDERNAGAGAADVALGTNGENAGVAAGKDAAAKRFGAGVAAAMTAGTPLSGEELLRMNREFDGALFSAFPGHYTPAIQTLNDWQFRMRSVEGPALAELAMAASLKVRFDPPLFILKQHTAATVRITSMFVPDPRPFGEVRLRLRLRSVEGRVLLEMPVSARLGLRNVVDQTLEVDTAALREGSYVVEMATMQGVELYAGRWNVAAGSLDEQRAENIEQLSSVTPESPELEQALAACKARNDLLTDEPFETISKQYLADLPLLAREVKAEVAALKRARDPYVRKTGDYWRVFNAGGDEIPLRIYAPSGLARAGRDARYPVVVAFHGAGANENLFAYGYGRGMIERLAERKGFIAVMPLTYPFLGDAEKFDRLLEAVEYDYPVDESRIYVLGHSLGAGAASGLITVRPSRIAAGVCLSGGGFNDITRPTLVICGEFDTIVPREIVQASAEEAAAAGRPVEFRMVKNYSHTLLLGNQLQVAIDWLLPHQHENPPK
jgi:pimeloyl-ACP methyl ester carboxylesterase